MKTLCIITIFLSFNIFASSRLNSHGLNIDPTKHSWELTDRTGEIYGSILNGSKGELTFTLNKSNLDAVPKNMSLKSFTNKNKKLLKVKNETNCRIINNINTCYYETSKNDQYQYQLFFTHKGKAFAFTFTSPKKMKKELIEQSGKILSALTAI